MWAWIPFEIISRLTLAKKEWVASIVSCRINSKNHMVIWAIIIITWPLKTISLLLHVLQFQEAHRREYVDHISSRVSRISDPNCYCQPTILCCKFLHVGHQQFRCWLQNFDAILILDFCFNWFQIQFHLVRSPCVDIGFIRVMYVLVRRFPENCINHRSCNLHEDIIHLIRSRTLGSHDWVFVGRSRRFKRFRTFFVPYSPLLNWIVAEYYPWTHSAHLLKKN